jgi:prolyl-tRNA synthetase
MFDGYSFDLNAEHAARSYERMRNMFERVFRRVELDTVSVSADSGEIGGSRSEMFLAAAASGEDSFLTEGGSAREALAGEAGARSAIEVGHIFMLGERYTAPLEVVVAGPDGVERPLHGGCYGIGISRLIPTLIEQHHDERGIIWPRDVAPFDVVVLSAAAGGIALSESAALAGALEALGLDVLLDTRPLSAGVKFRDAALIGIPRTLIVGRGAERGEVELEHRERAGHETVVWRETDLGALLARR